MAIAGFISEPQTRQECLAFLRGKDERKIGHNTYVRRLENDGAAIVYHTTNIITHEMAQDGTELTTVTTGGWSTVTTKGRLNAFTDLGLSSRRGIWHGKGGEYVDGLTYVNNAGRLDVDGAKAAARIIDGNELAAVEHTRPGMAA